MSGSKPQYKGKACNHPNAAFVTLFWYSSVFFLPKDSKLEDVASVPGNQPNRDSKFTTLETVIFAFTFERERSFACKISHVATFIKQDGKSSAVISVAEFPSSYSYNLPLQIALYIYHAHAMLGFIMHKCIYGWFHAKKERGGSRYILFFIRKGKC